jgi:hypothetical protein
VGGVVGTSGRVRWADRHSEVGRALRRNRVSNKRRQLGDGDSTDGSGDSVGGDRGRGGGGGGDDGDGGDCVDGVIGGGGGVAGTDAALTKRTGRIYGKEYERARERAHERARERVQERAGAERLEAVTQTSQRGGRAQGEDVRGAHVRGRERGGDNHGQRYNRENGLRGGGGRGDTAATPSARSRIKASGY